MLLDEPTAGLDPIGREEMLALVGRLAGFGISVLMATHLLDDVQQVCDHVVMIDGGQLRRAGATQALLDRTGAVRVEVHDGAARLADLLGVPPSVGRHRWSTTPRSTCVSTATTTATCSTSSATASPTSASPCTR